MLSCNYCITDHLFLSTADVAKLLLEETKIDLNAKNYGGNTPLHLACNFRFPSETVKLLVRDPRCNPLEKNNRGDTALHVASRKYGSGEAGPVYVHTL